MRAGYLFSRAPLRHTLVALGMSLLCESYLAAHQLDQMEPFYIAMLDGGSVAV
jgi:hypothetical protein